MTKQTMSFEDFDTVKGSEEGAVLTVMSPTTNTPMLHADGRPFTITLAGKDSARYRDAFRSQNDRNIAAQMRTKAPTKTAVMEKGNIELLVAATLEWDVVFDKSGAKAQNDPALYREAYTKYPWLAEQVDSFVGTTSNFLKT